ncbi:FAD-dependent oxidoreductase [Mucilaginibacter sp. ZT4R22]|uniref:FAD-dependent oxidoreductase n=1 Tax=Mucilaginibacter pankratovii TaxID=2772110 RepID=A0ABR7WK14_9SPHI|nr:FAD-dependent oxidoreductase [Mucilaginibacter pankratovii]MBD1362663.1 FAD-dependent oxidoreductase [Mucilaginibacter pankratovii]
MLTADYVAQRELKLEERSADLVVTGGGLSGVCAAITAARAGLKVILVQDRPVLGGNSSSEVRLWVLGATSHMGNNNRWAREGGLVDEILVENMYRNPEGNPLIFDTILLDKVVAEKNIQLLLNTAVYQVDKSSADIISSLTAFCSQNSTQYLLQAPLFCDCSGDGIVGFLSGAAFRMGAEAKEEFDEKFAPTEAYGELLGHSLYFYSKDTGKPVKYIAPDFALDDITKIPRFKSFNAQEFGCKLWWIEYGGRLDTVHDTEQIKWELWKVVYGTWNYIKNSGNFPEAENLALEWVGTIPGKRESRRFEGDYMLNQQDVVNQNTHFDAVAYGGWSIDLHPADGVFSEKPGCNQWHSKGIYQIPYRCLYSKNIKNLFLAGRIISASHVAFASTRVMATSAYVAQAVGVAAKICKDRSIYPADIIKDNSLAVLQKELLKSGQYIPGIALHDDADLVQSAKIHASSELVINAMDADTQYLPLEIATAQLIPLAEGECPRIVFNAEADEETQLKVELRTSLKIGNFTPDNTIASTVFYLKKGNNTLMLNFGYEQSNAAYVFIMFGKNPRVKLQFTGQRITGMLSVFNLVNKNVSNYGRQTQTEDIGVEEFEFWCPQRRPWGLNLALNFKPGLDVFRVDNIRNGIDRPTVQPNAWAASYDDASPKLTLEWEEAQSIGTIHLIFDTDYDHPMETVLIHHPESVMPFCVRNYTISDESGQLIYEKKGNYQTRNIIILANPVKTKKLIIHMEHPSALVPAALFAVRCYA